MMSSKRRSMSKVFAVVLCFVLVCTFVLVQNIPQTQAAFSKNAVGYYTAWSNMPPSSIPWTKVSHVIYAFFEITPDYNITPTEGMANFQQFVSAAEAAGAKNKCLISVGGWTRSEKFHEVSADATKRATFANNCLQWINQYGLGGVDIDWEFPGISRVADGNDRGNPAGYEDNANYTLLLKDLKGKLGSKVVAIGISAAKDKIAQTSPGQYINYVDFVNVMSYDFHGPWGEPYTANHSALYSDPNDKFYYDAKVGFNADYVMNYLASLVGAGNKYKINMGVPYYAQGYQGAYGIYSGYTGNAGGQTFATIKGWESMGTKYLAANQPGKVPYLLYNGNFYTYDDEWSIGNKCDYVKTNGFGGVMMWELSQDNGILTNVIYNKFNDGVAPIPTTVVVNTPVPTTSVGTYPAWNSNDAYNGAARVTYNNSVWEALWWTKGETPGVAGVWKLVGSAVSSPTPTNPPATATKAPTPTTVVVNTPVPTTVVVNTPVPTTSVGTYPVWNSNDSYNGAARVTYNNSVWEALWWTKGETPGVAGVWKLVGSAVSSPTPVVVGNTPTPSIITGNPAWSANNVYYAIGAKVSYGGANYECTFAHNSNVTWSPDVVITMWKKI